VKNISECITKYKTGTRVCNTSKQNWHAHMHLHDLADLDLKPIHILFTLYTHRFMTCLYFRCVSFAEWQKLEVVNSSHSPQSSALHKTPPPASTTHVEEHRLHRSSMVRGGELH
jgi:hypothetical protein